MLGQNTPNNHKTPSLLASLEKVHNNITIQGWVKKYPAAQSWKVSRHGMQITKSRQKQGKGGVNHVTHLFPPICCIFSNSNCVEHLKEWKLQNTCPRSPCPPPPPPPPPHQTTRTTTHQNQDPPISHNTHKRKGKRSNKKKEVFIIWKYIHNKRGRGSKEKYRVQDFPSQQKCEGKRKKRLNHLTAVFS